MVPTDGYLRLYLQRPELALVEESCTAEIALHTALVDHPRATVGEAQLTALQDADVTANYRYFLAFRDALHLQLQEYVVPVDREDFDRFLGEKSRELSERLEEAQDVMKRLKERE